MIRRFPLRNVREKKKRIGAKYDKAKHLLKVEPQKFENKQVAGKYLKTKRKSCSVFIKIYMTSSVYHLFGDSQPHRLPEIVSTVRT
jgi:hypothetical protein